MACCPGSNTFSTEQKYGATPGNSICSAITVDMLKMYKKPIDCYLNHDLHGQIGSSKEELQHATEYLQGFIDQKEIDKENCSGIEALSIIRMLVDKIVQKGVCL